MSLKLYYGAPHCGHTERIYDELIREAKAHPERRFIMLVPEQASLTVQEELVTLHPDHALSNIDVLTFQRLAHQVFRETRMETRDLIDDEGKLLFLQLAVSRNRSRLVELRRSAGRIGMLLALKSVFSEFAEYNVSPEKLREKAAELEGNRRLKRKLEDVLVLYEEFLKLVHERFELPEERMSVLAKTIRNWAAAPEVTIALDGFTGFTPPQYDVISAMISACREVRLGLTVGTAYVHEENRDPEDLFYMPDHAAEKVKELAVLAGQEIEEEQVSDADPRPEELRFLEQHLFALSGSEYPALPEAIRILRGRTFREEITFVIREIEKNIRNGLRYREMAIVTGDLEGYREELEERLREAGLPFFIDANKKLDHSPIMRLILDAVRVARAGFAYDAVFSFVKNPLVEKSGGPETGYERIAEVENFALARGFRSKSGYQRKWEGGYRGFQAFRIDAVNETRKAVFSPLIAFYEAMTGGTPTVAVRAAAVKRLVEYYATEKALADLAAEVEKESGTAVGKEYEAVLTFVHEYLDRASEVIGELVLTVEEFEDVILAGLARAELGLVPPTKDRLIVGNLTRTRLGHVRKLFVIGANEGKLPVAPSGSGVLNDRDREALKEMNLPLAETAEENAYNNRYYLYLLLNEPTESLILTYATAETDGHGLLPAAVVGSLLRLFPEIRTEETDQGYFPDVFSRDSGLYALSGALRAVRAGEKRGGSLSEEDRARTLYQWFRSTDAYADAIRQIGDGLYYHYQKEVLPKDLAEKLYGEVLYGSVSRLEQFAECPYKHFLHYGLEIEPRAVYELAAADLGTIAHASIERFFSALREDGRVWTEISEEEQEALVTHIVNEVAAEYGNSILSDSARNVFLTERIRRIMVRTLWALSRQWAAGSFTSTENEWKFRTDLDRDLELLSPETGLRLALSGRIDRIDVAEDGQKVYVKVIDYKSSTRDLDYTKIFHGLQLQLLLYLEVALKREQKRSPGKEVVPAGIYYYTVQDPFVEDVSEEGAERELLQSLRMTGLTNSDPDVADKIDRAVSETGESGVVKKLKYKKEELTGNLVSGEELEKLGAFSVRKAEELSERVAEGEICASPFVYGGGDGCRYCDYRNVCGQDRRLRSFESRPLEEKRLEDVIGGGEHAGMD